MDTDKSRIAAAEKEARIAAAEKEARIAAAEKEARILDETKKVTITWKKLKIYIVVSVLILIVANVVIFYVFSAPILVITINGSETASVYDDKLTFILNNDLNSQNKNVNVYSFNGPTTIDIVTSPLIDISGDIVKLIVTPSRIDNVGPTPQEFSITIDPLNKGLYHGTIFISDGSNYSPVPMLVNVKPQMPIFAILVVDGIALSIAAWSFIKFFNERYKIEIGDSTMPGLYIAGKARASPLSIEDFLAAKIVTKDVLYENAILNIGTMLFGIALAMTALIDNSFINGIHNLGILEIVFLIGIGLGIGSLKEFLYKS